MTKKYSYWLSSGKYSMMQKFSVVLFGLLTFMLLTRLFSPQHYAVWGLFMVISSIVETSRNALIKNGYILFTNTSHESELGGIEYAAFLTNCIFSVFLIALFLTTAHPLEQLFHTPGLSTILIYYSFTLLLLIPFSQREIYLNARMDFKGVFWMYFVRNGSFLLCVALFFFLKKEIGFRSLAIYYSLCTLLGVIAGFMSLGKHQPIKMKWDKKIFQKFLNFGKYVFGNNFFSLFFRSTDNFMAAHFFSPSALAYYNTSIRITNFSDIPSQVMGDIMFPKATQIVKSGKLEDIKRIYEKTVAATLTFIIPVIIFTLSFTKEIIYILAGKNYLEAATILKITIFYAIFLPFIKQFGNIMDATGRPQVNFWLMVFFAGFNIGSNYFFIHYFDFLGAALGTLFSYFTLFLVTQIILTKTLRINQIAIIKNVFSFYPDYFKLARTSFSKLFG